MTGNLSISAGQRYEHIANLIRKDFSPPADIVELGGAPGDQIASLSRLGYTATAVDIGQASDEWSDGTEGRMAALFDSAGVAYVEWNLEITPYPLKDSSFDIVLMTEVFEHLREYPITSLEETMRILRPGGRLYLTTPNVAYVMNRVRSLMGRSVATPLEDWIGGLPFARHAREYTFAEMSALVERVGLEVRDAHSRHFHQEGGSQTAMGKYGKRVLDGVARRYRTLGPSIVMVAQKPI